MCEEKPEEQGQEQENEETPDKSIDQEVREALEEDRAREKPLEEKVREALDPENEENIEKRITRILGDQKGTPRTLLEYAAAKEREATRALLEANKALHQALKIILTWL